MKERIRVLIADDSPFVCRLLSSYLIASAGFEIVPPPSTDAARSKRPENCIRTP